jgi:crotonobetainyl-CoA:carnitine CoA-transferase CaiB-like acyl-CoA transferase
VMIGRPDLLEDAELARAATRFERRDEFLKAVHEYTTKRTTDAVLEDAALMRIPSGPVLNGQTVTSFEQFVAKSVFEPDAAGRFLRPRRPYRIDGDRGPAAGPVPGPGDHTGTVEWTPRPAGEPSPWRLPLDGVRVIDCTAWWAGPVAPHALACLGADVIKVESVTRPDLMRYAAARPPSQDRWYEWGAVFHGANAGKRGITLDLTRPECIEVFERLVTTADVVVENYTPRVMGQFGLGWERLHELNPRLTMVRMPAFGLDGPWRDRTGFAQTMECITGMAWVTGHRDGPPVLVRGACDPIAGMHAVIGTLLALMQRDRDGQGRMVETVMVEAALNVAAEQVVEYTASGTLLERDGNRGPVAAPQGVYPCTGDDRWVAIAVATDEQWAALVEAVGRPAWATDEKLATVAGRRAAHDRIDEELARWSAYQDAEDLAGRLVAAGVPAAPVITPRDIVANPQLRHRRLFEVLDHPVTGRHEIPGFPVRFAHVDAWYRRAAPTLGQHNDEVLTEIGLAHEIPRLRALGLIGDRVVGA